MESMGPVRVAFETARMRLVSLRGDSAEARSTAYEIACRLSANTLGVERVSVWQLGERNNSIRRMVQYTRSTNRCDREPAAIWRSLCPRYFEAMLSRRVVVASDAVSDSQTRELADYLKAGGIGALLDAPIYREGIVIGIVCHEHSGGPRDWTEREATFASAVADMLTILVEQAERAELREALAAERQAAAQHQKMVALQRLGRVVAHDLNNVLTVAMSRTELLQDDDDPTETSKQVASVLAYGARLVRQLGDFCKDSPSSSQCDLADLLRRLEPSLQSLLGKHVKLTLDVQTDTFLTCVPPVEAEQMVLNLCMNAGDAIVGLGSVHVALTQDPQTTTGVLDVRDTGVGMDEETQTRVFEPYFSTKPNHSGVGLMAVYGIVQRARGSIAVNSALGAGTSFQIRLPQLPPSVATEAPWDF